MKQEVIIAKETAADPVREDLAKLGLSYEAVYEDDAVLIVRPFGNCSAFAKSLHNKPKANQSCQFTYKGSMGWVYLVGCDCD